ncbi:class I SAM-dependent methyltransferase [Candidatus Omnitrophota bacterium]
MKKQAYEKYLKESNNWLHRGRGLLLKYCMELYCPSLEDENKVLDILEVGAGSGRNLEVLSKFGIVDAIEIEPMAIKEINRKQNIRNLYTQKAPFELEQKYNVICAMDILEHVHNDKEVYVWITQHLKPDGILFLTVPAYQFLYCSHDIALYHYRRYDLNRINALNDDKLEFIKKGYFNFSLFPFIAITRFLDRYILRGSKYAKKQLSSVPPVFDRIFFSVLKKEASLVKRYNLFPFGLTAFAVLKKNR